MILADSAAEVVGDRGWIVLRLAVTCELRRRCNVRVEHGGGVTLRQRLPSLGLQARYAVAQDRRVGAGRIDAHRPGGSGICGNAHMTDDGSTFLGEPGDVEDGSRTAFQIGGHGDNGADGHNPCTADARYQYIAMAGRRVM